MMIRGEHGFIEQDCKIKVDGHEFSAGGSWLCKRKDTGKYEGQLYMYLENQIRDKRGRLISCRPMIGSWDGSIKVPCHRGKEWRSNFGDLRQAVGFRWNGIPFTGIHYSKEQQNVVKVREIKEENY